MRHLVLLSTGGTIATLSHTEGRQVGVDARELLRATAPFPGLEDVRVEPWDTGARVSFAASVADILKLAGMVRSAAAEADGVVVTHGTDTLEESAFLVALAHPGPQPVVFTGAQRPFDDPAPDGARNLSAALRWAADERAVGTGVTVAFADRVLPAVGVRKSHSLGLEAFSAPGRGQVGQVDEAGVRRFGSAPRAALLPPEVTDLPRVDVIPQYLGVDASAVDHAIALGARGLVLAAFGAGNAAPDTVRACLRLLETGFPVLVTSRTGAGATVGLYAGGGSDLAAAGAVFAGDLSPWQARLLLASVLAVESDPHRVGAACREWLCSTGVTAGSA